LDKQTDHEYLKISKEEKEEGMNTIKITWMELLKAAKIENTDGPIKSKDILDPCNKTCQFILFLYSLHYS
jgi:hypothetical protein